MSYFDGNVSAALSSEGVTLTNQQMAICIAKCKEADLKRTEYTSKQDPAKGMPFPIWHRHNSTNDSNLGHWMIITNQAKRKLMVNITTAEKRFLKLDAAAAVRAPEKNESSQQSYLSQKVLDLLSANKVNLTANQLRAYQDVCQLGIGRSLPFKESKNTLKLPYSIWFTRQSAQSNKLTPWLVLSSPKEWKAKRPQNDLETATKILINLESAEKRVLKVRRPIPGNPDGAMRNDHIFDSKMEAQNNREVNLDAYHEDLYSQTSGTRKAYLFMPFVGEQNLATLLNNPSIGGHEILKIMMSCGRELQDVHARGFVHADVKPQNFVIDKSKRTVTLIDYEFMLSKNHGQYGRRLLAGTDGYAHPEWVKESEQRWMNGDRVIYHTQNDVYAYLVTAQQCLAVARWRNPVLQNQTDPILNQIEAWKKSSFMSMPDLDEVMSLFRKELVIAPVPQIAMQNQVMADVSRRGARSPGK